MKIKMQWLGSVAFLATYMYCGNAFGASIPAANTIICHRIANEVLTPLEVSGALSAIRKVISGSVKVSVSPKLYKVMSDRNTNAQMVDDLMCAAEQRGELDPHDVPAVDYLRQELLFMWGTQPPPSPADMLAWMAQRPRPPGLVSQMTQGEADGGNESSLATSNYTCDTFYPTTNPKLAQLAEQHYGDDISFWNTVASEGTLETELNVRRQQLEKWLNKNNPQSSANHAPMQQEWGALLRTHCDLLNNTLLRRRESFDRFEWLTTIYLKRISKGGGRTPGKNNRCSLQSPLSDRGVALWRLWEAYNIGHTNSGPDAAFFYEWVIDQAGHLSQTYFDEARSDQLSLPDLEKSKLDDKSAKCEILKRGVLNDMVAAYWLQALSLQAMNKDARAAFANVMCLSKGVVYDPASDEFWRPADRLSGYQCRESPLTSQKVH